MIEYFQCMISLPSSVFACNSIVKVQKLQDISLVMKKEVRSGSAQNSNLEDEMRFWERT